MGFPLQVFELTSASEEGETLPVLEPANQAVETIMCGRQRASTSGGSGPSSTGPFGEIQR